MLTPVFELCQDDNFVTITIKTPFAKVSETEIFIEHCEFKFYSKPYYLRLNLPGSIVEDGRETAEYEAETGVFTIRAGKATPGQYFDGLDMLTKLLAPSGRATAAVPLIETLDGVECQDEDEEFDWQIEQNVCDEEVLLKGPRYGFANQRSGILTKLQVEIPDIIDLPEADSVSRKDRTDLRLADELEHFDDDYYIADLYDDEAIQSLLDFQPWWEKVYKKSKSGAAPEELLVFTNLEREKMKLLPRKEYILYVLDKRDECTALLSLVDIIFAYAYDHRTTEGENNVESGWTLRKLSATLSWLEVYSRPEEVVTACYRRCLSYPLYRHWKLTTRVFRDVRHVFTAGRRCLLRCLLDVHSLLMDGDSRYILNDLYITDYCVWIQQVSEKKLSSLARQLTQVKITKDDTGFELGLLEHAAELAVEEQREAANQITDGVAAMTVTSANQITDGVSAMTFASANQSTDGVAAMTVAPANQSTDGVAAMTVAPANQSTDGVAAMTVAPANQSTDGVAAMTVASANTTRGSECQKETKTNNGDIAALAAELQIDESSDETVNEVSLCEVDTQQKMPEHARTSRDSIPELSTITAHTPKLSTVVVNDDLVQNIEISDDTASHLGSSEVTSCERRSGFVEENSHDAVESHSSSDSESESSGSDSCEESDCTDTDSGTSDESATDDNLACRQDTANDKEQEIKHSQTTLINDMTSLNF